MKRVAEWFWRYGKDRAGTWEIPPSWLDNVVTCAEREEAINAQHGRGLKACLALWGASQSGKSTLLSHYLDGNAQDGMDSALTWSAFSRARFTRPPSGVVPSGTTVLNPYHLGSDASGVATRFYLPSNPAAINPNYPVELALTSRKQILHALTQGYMSVCEVSADFRAPLSPAALEEKLAPYANAAGTVHTEAFALLRDFCDVCRFVGRDPGCPRFAEFAKDDRMRGSVLRTRGLISNPATALRFVKETLWADAAAVSAFYDHLAAVSDRLAQAGFGAKRVLTTLRVAAVLEDIDSVSATDPGVQKLISGLAYKVQGDDLILADSLPDGAAIPPEDFGCFQALVGELRIPLNPAKLKASSFKSYLAHGDIIDFPGVTNKAAGVDATQVIDGRSASETELLTRLYKTGKTLSVIYGQQDGLSIDAFCILVAPCKGALRKPKVIEDGVKAWVNTFQPDWDWGKGAPEVKLYLNLSCMGETIRNFKQSTDGLKPVVDFIRDLRFADKETVDFVFTNSKFFPLPEEQRTDACRDEILGDQVFAETCIDPKSRESLAAVLRDRDGDAANEHLFARFDREITTENRERLYGEMLARERKHLKQLVAQQLPSENGEVWEEREKILRRVDANAADEREKNPQRLDAFLKRVFFVPPESLGPLPKGIKQMTQEDLVGFVVQQFAGWRAGAHPLFDSADDVPALLDDPAAQTTDFLKAISSVDLDTAATRTRGLFAYVRSASDAQTARHYLATLMNNHLLYGSDQAAAIAADDAYPLITAFRNRIMQVIDRHYADMERKPQPGDSELTALRDALFAGT